MMKNIEFYKLQASGNDFILIENEKLRIKNEELKKFAIKYCERKFGIGGDGLLVIEPSRKADFRMRIFNPDGSEAQMCGNGSRCTALWAEINNKGKQKNPKIRFDTMAGVIEAKVSGVGVKEGSADVKVKMTDVSEVKLDKEIKVSGRKMKVNFINTGVPHTVVFVQGLDSIDIEKIGAAIRFHKNFMPAGTNVNFVEILKNNLIKIRTYERGVEAETLACGTGAAAGAIVSRYKLANNAALPNGQYKVNVSTKSKEPLRVYFSRHDNKITDIWLEGKAYLVYQGISIM